MIKVECESCKAPYELDEKRIPDKGMKMRCPKCGTSFLVTKSGGGASPAPPAPPPSPGIGKGTVMGIAPGAIPVPPSPAAAAPAPPAPAPAPPAPAAAPAPPAPAPAPPAPAAPALGKGTVMGIAPPTLGGTKDAAPAAPAGVIAPPFPEPAAPAPAAPALSSPAKGAFGGTMIGGAAPAPPAPAPPAPAAPPAPSASAGGVDVPDNLPPPAAGQRDIQDLSVSHIQLDHLPNPNAEVDLPAPVASKNQEVDLPAPRPAARAPGAVAPAPAAAEVDLPAPKGGFGAVPLPGDDVDLPAPKGGLGAAQLPADDADLPAPKGGFGAAPKGGFGALELPGDDADLPAVKQEADLPAPKGGFGAVDLPGVKQDADLPAVKNDADLPAPKGGADLPAPKGGFGDLDLPTTKADVDLPVAKGGSDLPAPTGDGGFGDLELPPPGGVELPAPKHELPVPKGGESSFADLELPDLPPSGGAPAAPRADSPFGDIELPPPKPAADLVPPKARTVQGHGAPAAAPPSQETSFGDLGVDSELPPSLQAEDETSFGDIGLEDEIPMQQQAPPQPQGGMPPAAEYGSVPPSLLADDVDELSLDDIEAAPLADSDLLEEEYYEEGEYEEGEYEEGEYEGGEYDDGYGEEAFDDEEDMEFGIGGDADERGYSLPPELVRRQRGEDFEAKQQARGKRTVRVIAYVAGALILLVGASASLALTEYGVFGIYIWEEYLPEAGNPQQARGAIDRAEKIASTDTYADVISSLNQLGRARGEAGLNRELLTRSLVHESLFILRFGDNPKAAARAAAITRRLTERSWRAPGADLAKAADAARRKKWGEANGLLKTARTQSPSDPLIDLLAGEMAIAQGKLEPAEKAFANALKNGAGARAQWGLARVALSRDDLEAQVAAVSETLNLSPQHVEARIAESRIQWLQGKEESALHLLKVALGLEPTEEDTYLWSSKKAVASGYSVLGFTHETRGRLSPAREAYKKALGADPYRVEALLGSGRVALRETRYGDALAAFESALSTAQKGGSNPIVLSGRTAGAEAQLGIGRALLKENRAPEAKTKLEALVESLPEDPEVVLALGETEQRMSNPEVAEAHFRRSMELEPTEFAGYLALSQLFTELGDPAKASQILNEAAAYVPESAEMRRMLGQSELARNRLEAAVHEFSRSLELNPHDMQARYGMGIALRKAGQLERARNAFDQIAAQDPDYAGLAEQRGLLHEARGEHDKAVQAYTAALEKDENDTGLLLRLGAAQVAANDLDAAEQTLDKVIRERPNSAEAEYFIGRVQFARGRTPDALTHFDRAVALDPNVGEYRLYVARASFDMGNIGRAMEEVQKALAKDPSLGDAYWVRGKVRLRQGVVKDALRDESRALKLNPARTDAYAVMGECYDQLRDLSRAIQAYRTALNREPDNGYWWFRIGTIYAHAGKHGEADKAVKKSIAIGEETDPRPDWLADAYSVAGEQAETARNRKMAIRLYKRYLVIAPISHFDYEAIQDKLKGWGVSTEDSEY